MSLLRSLAGPVPGERGAGVGMLELARITARRSELDTLAWELGKQLAEVRAERGEVVIADQRSPAGDGLISAGRQCPARREGCLEVVAGSADR